MISFDTEIFARFISYGIVKSTCRDAILEFLHLAHIVKISDEELEFITGYDNMDKAKEVLFKGNVKTSFICTKGKDGAEGIILRIKLLKYLEVLWM